MTEERIAEQLWELDNRFGKRKKVDRQSESETESKSESTSSSYCTSNKRKSQGN